MQEDYLDVPREYVASALEIYLRDNDESQIEAEVVEAGLFLPFPMG